VIIVPDASVILKWVLEKESEPDYYRAIELQEAFLAEQIGDQASDAMAIRSWQCPGTQEAGNGRRIDERLAGL
jgi:hypothetical protein